MKSMKLLSSITIVLLVFFMTSIHVLAAAKLIVDPLVIRSGSVPEGVPVIADVTVMNAGDEVANILDVKTN